MRQLKAEKTSSCSKLTKAMSKQSGPHAEMAERVRINQVGSLPIVQTNPPAWAAAIGSVIHHVMNDFGGGPRLLKLAWVIDFQKLATIPLFGTLIAWYHNTSVAAWIYLGMQCTYGLVWLIKDLAFPDPNFHKRITIGAGIASFLSILGWYWVFGWLLISGIATPKYPLPDYAWFQPMHKPLHTGLRDHDRLRCAEVFHTPIQT